MTENYENDEIYEDGDFYEDDDIETDYIMNYWVYETDEDGDEIDCINQFADRDEAIRYADCYEGHCHVVAVPNVDPDDDPAASEYFEYFCNDSPYEVIWNK